MSPLNISKKSFCKLLMAVAAAMIGLSSCVPLAIGAAGAAGGYMMREKGIGVADPIDSEGSYDSGGSTGYDDAPVY